MVMKYAPRAAQLVYRLYIWLQVLLVNVASRRQILARRDHVKMEGHASRVMPQPSRAPATQDT